MSPPNRPTAAENVLAEAQDILGRYLEPGVAMTDRECINQLLEVLDGPVAVLLQEEADARHVER
ncbi:MAG TPA: hypothetical protein VGN80_18950 [Devosiaceae bacterium]|jgi:hypothetical protein|nr:hypothetical protein [Devosiaceae bacterium]